MPVLSVLDLAPVAEGSTAGDALRNSVDLSRTVERLGFHRHWVAEHHNTPGIASGRITLVNACRGVAPSIWAACSSSHGISLKNADSV